MHAQDETMRVLKPGPVIEREMAGEEVHHYRLTLTSGQYLRLGVESKNLDSAVTLYGPDGRTAADERLENIPLGQ